MVRWRSEQQLGMEKCFVSGSDCVLSLVEMVHLHFDEVDLLVFDVTEEMCWSMME